VLFNFETKSSYMYYYVEVAIRELMRIEKVIKIEYSGFKQLDYAIRYLRATEKAELDAPNFKAMLYNKDGLSLSLIFNYDGFEFRHFDGNYYPVHIKVSYETGKATQHDGSLEDWESLWSSLLGKYQRSQAQGEESEVELGFYESY
jgi:hypothetical protein